MITLSLVNDAGVMLRVLLYWCCALLRVMMDAGKICCAMCATDVVISLFAGWAVVLKIRFVIGWKGLLYLWGWLVGGLS